MRAKQQDPQIQDSTVIRCIFYALVCVCVLCCSLSRGVCGPNPRTRYGPCGCQWAGTVAKCTNKWAQMHKHTHTRPQSVGRSVGGLPSLSASRPSATAHLHTHVGRTFCHMAGGCRASAAAAVAQSIRGPRASCHKAGHTHKIYLCVVGGTAQNTQLFSLLNHQCRSTRTHRAKWKRWHWAI